MDMMGVFVLAGATATHQVAHVKKQSIYIPFGPMDMAVFALRATATHRVGHFQQQKLHTAPIMRSMGRAVFALAATARH